MRQYEAPIGKKYVKLTVEASADPTPKGSRRCECGETTVVSEGNLKQQRTKSCGCIKSPDLTGQVFGRLTVMGRSDKRSPRGERTTPLWECECECGKVITCLGSLLVTGRKSSCGCDSVKNYAYSNYSRDNPY